MFFWLFSIQSTQDSPQVSPAHQRPASLPEAVLVDHKDGPEFLLACGAAEAAAALLLSDLAHSVGAGRRVGFGHLSALAPEEVGPMSSRLIELQVCKLSVFKSYFSRKYLNFLRSDP